MNELKRILLVEDDLQDVQLILSALEAFHLANEVAVARDGVEALEYLRREGLFSNRTNAQPVVVFLDIKMPKMNGLEVLREIRSDPALKLIPVVMVTSSREERDLLQSYQLGVNAYVVKPIDFNQFNQAITKLGLFWAVVNQPPPGTASER